MRKLPDQPISLSEILESTTIPAPFGSRAPVPAPEDTTDRTDDATLATVETVFCESQELWVSRLKAEGGVDWSDLQFGRAATVLTSAEYQWQAFTDFARKLSSLPPIGGAEKADTTDHDRDADSLVFTAGADSAPAAASDEWGAAWISDLTGSVQDDDKQTDVASADVAVPGTDHAEAHGRAPQRAGLGSRSHLEVLAFLALQSYQSAVAAAVSAPEEFGVEQQPDDAPSGRSSNRAELPPQDGNTPIDVAARDYVDAAPQGGYVLTAAGDTGSELETIQVNTSASPSPAYSQSYLVADPESSGLANPVPLSNPSDLPHLQIGTDGNDVMIGTDGVDIMRGGAGDDVLEGRGDADVIDGGSGNDTSSYAHSTEAVQVDLTETSAQVSSGDASGDILIEIENLTGSSHDDKLSGNAEANILSGGGGDDTLEGREGGDTLIGGGGRNTASYERSNESVQVDLAVDGPQVSSGDANGDVLVTIQDVIGSSQADSLSGDDGANELSGGGGDDKLEGREGGDKLVGGGGLDTASYEHSGQEVQIDLAAVGPQDSHGDGSGDILVEIENVTGSSHNDTLSGDANANLLSGGGGDDILQGSGGGDYLDGGSGNDTASYHDSGEAIQVDLSEAGPQSSSGDGAGDTLVAIENVTGSSYDDTLVGNAESNVLSGGGGDDALYGNEGNDVLDGGSGADAMVGGGGNDIYVVDYTGDSIFEEGGGGVDTVAAIINYFALSDNVENLVFIGNGQFEGVGNDLNNVITGGSLSDLLSGGGGDDHLSGGSGDDHLDGGDGDDELDGGEGSNWLDGGAGNDWLIIFSGKDTIVLQPGFGNDVVEGFGGHGKDGFDMIDVTAYHFQDFMLGTDILVLSLGDDTVLTIGTDTLTLLNTKSGDVSSSDFIYH